MKFANPFDVEFWVMPEPIEPSNVVRLNTAHARANAAQSATLLEDDRIAFEVSPTRAEERRLWNAYMAAIRRSVAAQDEVNETHRAWMNYADSLPNPKT